MHEAESRKHDKVEVHLKQSLEKVMAKNAMGSCINEQFLKKGQDTFKNEKSPSQQSFALHYDHKKRCMSAASTHTKKTEKLV